MVNTNLPCTVNTLKMCISKFVEIQLNCPAAAAGSGYADAEREGDDDAPVAVVALDWGRRPRVDPVVQVVARCDQSVARCDQVYFSVTSMQPQEHRLMPLEEDKLFQQLRDCDKIRYEETTGRFFPSNERLRGKCIEDCNP